MHASVRVSLFALLAGCVPVLSIAQSTPVVAPGVQDLQKHLMASPGTVTLVAAELRLSQLSRADVRVENGQIHLRMQNTLMKLDSDDIEHANDVLLVRKVEATSEKKNDYLRITVGLSDGKSVPVAFELAKGALSSMDAPSLEKLIAPVFTTGGSLATSGTPAESAAPAAGGPAAAPAAPPSPPEAPMGAIAPPPPPPEEAGKTPAAASGTGNGSWRLSELTTGHEAMVIGTAGSNGASNPAVFGIICGLPQKMGADFKDTGKPQLLLEMRAHKDQISLSNPLYCDPNMNTGATVTLEGKAAEHGKVCNSTQDPTGALWNFEIILPDRSVRDIAAGTGKSVTVRLGSAAKPDEVIAHFDLPSDGAALKAVMSACAAPAATRAPVKH
jgi:hypothetical protein